ncbi:reticulon-4 isoform X6 [Hyla sarda]|uniref:reticulon-4 isoform X6 n=1 Tax=Hyla sarda TaxID=327740 RepID=UPI0024C350B6|nr:reticulon-4 isoform X6 [Hyla sarda]
MEDQSPYVTSSSYGKEDAEDQHRGPGEAKPWDIDDVLDLTGGAGQLSHPTFSVSFPGKEAAPAAEEDDEEEKGSYLDSLEPSPEDEDPSSIGSDLPRATVIPSAPQEEHDRPAAPHSAPARPASADVNLFPLPASSAPLMHSSSGKFCQPSSTVPAGQEELSSLLLESATSLHSLSPLSADSSKEQLVAFPADSTTPEAFKDPIRDERAVSRTLDDFPIVEKLASGLEYRFPEATDHKGTSVAQEKGEDLFFSERGYAVEHPTSFPESSSSGDHAKLYTQSAKEMFSGMLKSVEPPHEEFSDLKEGPDEQYVDFKPLASTWGYGGDFEPRDVSVDLKSNITKSLFESKFEEKYDEEKDVDVSDDISPASPEATSDSPNYNMFAPLQQTNPFSFGGNQVADNVTDERKMEELKSHVPPSRLGANVATVNPFLVNEEADYVSTDTVHGSVASKPEGLTPDIVQEAYESHDTGVPKLGYEPKIDLVQTAAKASQESVSPSVQNVALFEDADSVSSPVLPDIVMEAPVTSAPAGLDALAPQPDVSPVGRITPVSEEKIKFESEKPLSYEEAINKASAKEQEHVPVHVETVKEAPLEDPETPYISIACDLVKEIIPEQVATDFSKALKSEFDSQFYSHFEESSPESEQSEPSYKLWEAEVIPKETSASVLSTGRSVTPEKDVLSESKWKAPSPTKSYLESTQSKSYENVVAEEPIVQKSNPDKILQMEDFGKADYSKDFDIPSTITPIKERSTPHKEEPRDVKAPKWQEDQVPKEQPKVKEDVSVKEKAKESSDKVVDLSNKAGSGPSIKEEPVSKPVVPAKEPSVVTPASKEKKETSPATIPLASCNFQNKVVDLLYWRDIKKSGAVFGASLFLLLSLTVFSIVSVAAYIALALLSVSISFRIYKGVLQAIQKSDDGHPFKALLDSNIAVSEDLVQKYCNVALSHINCTIKELRRLFLVEDLVDSLKFAVLMWVFTYIGALFNGLTLLILALISLFSIPVIYERHQTQIDHYLSLVNKNVKNISDLVQSKIPGLKRKAD